MLTRRQAQLLDFIRFYSEANGFPPSFDEMRDAVDLKSKSGIHRLVHGLRERGCIRALPHRARSIELIQQPTEYAKGLIDGLRSAPTLIRGAETWEGAQARIESEVLRIRVHVPAAE